VEPLPETVEAVEDYGPFVVENEDLLAELAAKAAQVVQVVPQCVGVSLASNRDGVSFTMVATSAEVAALDAVQYLAGGPCVAAVDLDEVVRYEPVTGEERWRLFARATAAAGVASTLTLPLVVDDVVVGSVNLYAAAPDVFAGHHEELAAVFGAWAAGAVTDADLSFSTRRVAEQAPRLLREDLDIHVAIGLIAAQDHVASADARARLDDAARRAGVSEALMASTVIELAGLDDSD